MESGRRQEPFHKESGSLFSLSRSTRGAAGPPVPKESRSIGSLSPKNPEAGQSASQKQRVPISPKPTGTRFQHFQNFSALGRTCQRSPRPRNLQKVRRRPRYSRHWKKRN